MGSSNLKIATPISHIFKNQSFSSRIIEASDCLECRDNSLNIDIKKQFLYHCDLQPIHRFSSEDINRLIKIKCEKINLKLISFHMASCYEKPIIKNGVFYPRGNKISKKELKANAKFNIEKIREIFGDTISISVENNNRYNTDAYDYVTDANFIKSIVCENDINFLFDISHAKITAKNSGIDYHSYITNLPLDKMNQIHISKECFDSDGAVFDAHELPSEEETKDIIKFIKDFDQTKYITVEYYKDPLILEDYLKNLKNLL